MYGTKTNNFMRSRETKHEYEVYHKLNMVELPIFHHKSTTNALSCCQSSSFEIILKELKLQFKKSPHYKSQKPYSIHILNM